MASNKIHRQEAGSDLLTRIIKDYLKTQQSFFGTSFKNEIIKGEITRSNAFLTALGVVPPDHYEILRNITGNHFSTTTVNSFGQQQLPRLDDKSLDKFILTKAADMLSEMFDVPRLTGGKGQALSITEVTAFRNSILAAFSPSMTAATEAAITTNQSKTI